MPNYFSIVTWQDYGHIEICLRDLMDARGITRNRLAHLIDTRFEVVDRLYHGRLERIDLDILARICFVLDCKVSDILVFAKEPSRSAR